MLDEPRPRGLAVGGGVEALLAAYVRRRAREEQGRGACSGAHTLALDVFADCLEQGGAASLCACVPWA